MIRLNELKLDTPKQRTLQILNRELELRQTQLRPFEMFAKKRSLRGPEQARVEGIKSLISEAEQAVALVESDQPLTSALSSPIAVLRTALEKQVDRCDSFRRVLAERDEETSEKLECEQKYADHMEWALSEV